MTTTMPSRCRACDKTARETGNAQPGDYHPVSWGPAFEGPKAEYICADGHTWTIVWGEGHGADEFGTNPGNAGVLHP